MTRIAFMCAAATTLAACGMGHESKRDAEQRFDLGVRGAGFDGHESEPVTATVVRASDGAIVGVASRDRVEVGEFAFLWTAILERDVAYQLIYHFGASCAEAGSDVYRVTIDP